MAKIVLIGLDQSSAGQICLAITADDSQIEQRPQDVFVQELLDADIVFAGGEPACYLSLLRHIRQARPTLPFVVVTRIPETKDWLDALQAGATDYCSEPIERRQLQWLMESALPPAPLRDCLNCTGWPGEFTGRCGSVLRLACNMHACG